LNINRRGADDIYNLFMPFLKFARADQMSKLSEKRTLIQDLFNTGLSEMAKIKQDCQKNGGSYELMKRKDNIKTPNFDDQEFIENDEELSELEGKFYDEIRSLYILILEETPIAGFMQEIDNGSHEAAWDLQDKYFQSYGLPGDWLDSDDNYDEFLRISIIGATKCPNELTRAYRKSMLAWYYQIYENFKEAEKWCLDALKDDPSQLLAAFTLGEMYSNDQLEQNFKKAEQYLTVAAEYDHEDAMGQLAYVLIAGKQGPDNEKRAFLLASEAHKLGSQRGTNVLAYCYENGVGTKKNGPKAKELYAQAAEDNSC
jgi:TPR repeat protein